MKVFDAPADTELLGKLGRSTANQRVERMEVTFSLGLRDNTRLLQEVGNDTGTGDGETLVELELNVLPESRRVVVADGRCIPKRFKNRRRL